MNFLPFLLVLVLFTHITRAKYYYPRPPYGRPAHCTTPPNDSLLFVESDLDSLKNVVFTCGKTTTFTIPLVNTTSGIDQDEITAFLVHKDGVDESGCLVHPDHAAGVYRVSCFTLSHGEYSLIVRVGHPFCHSFTMIDGRCTPRNTHPFLRCNGHIKPQWKEYYEANYRSRAGTYHTFSYNVTASTDPMCVSPERIRSAPTCTETVHDTSVYTYVTGGFTTPREALLFEKYRKFRRKGCFLIRKPHHVGKRGHLFDRENHCFIDPQMSKLRLMYKAPSHGRILLGMQVQRYRFENNMDRAFKHVSDPRSLRIYDCPVSEKMFNCKSFDLDDLFIKHEWLFPTSHLPNSYNTYDEFDAVIVMTGGWEIMIETHASSKYGNVGKVMHSIVSNSSPRVYIIGDPKNEKRQYASHQVYYVTRALRRSVMDIQSICDNCVVYSDTEALSRNLYWSNDSDDSHINMEIYNVLHDHINNLVRNPEARSDLLSSHYNFVERNSKEFNTIDMVESSFFTKLTT
ncbi:hypothetical protein PCE1_003412 [Barthelona sp. PCE]